MVWFTVDDGLSTSPKVLSIPRAHRMEAMGLWVTAGSWCGKHLTDGGVPTFMLDEWGATVETAEMLVVAGLWVSKAGGYQFHAWDEYQQTKNDVETTRSINREKKRRQRRNARGQFADSPENTGEDVSNVPEGVTGDNRVSPPGSHAVPSLPFPTQPSISLVQPPAETSKRPATAYPEEFEQWWSEYPRRESKGDALKAWNTLKKGKLLPPVQVLVAASRSYAGKVDDPQFIKLPAGWLRAHKWNDEAAAVHSEVAPSVHPQLARWLDEVGLSHDEYLERKDEPGFLDAMNGRRKHG